MLFLFFNFTPLYGHNLVKGQDVAFFYNFLKIYNFFQKMLYIFLLLEIITTSHLLGRLAKAIFYRFTDKITKN